MIKTMIVDDEHYSRERLIRLLEKHKEFEIVAQATNGVEALDILRKSCPDVLFLDVEMPGMTGLEVAGTLVSFDKPPLVVFATAYDQYALEAFEKNAIDFVLKPFQPERLEKTFARIKEKVERNEPSKDRLIALEQHLAMAGKIKRLVGHRRKSTARIMFNPKEAYFFEVQAGEVVAHLQNDSLIIRSTLQDILGTLDPEHFIQTHKAYVVNIEKIERVESLFKGDYEIVLKDLPEGRIPLSRSFVPSLKALLGSW